MMDVALVVYWTEMIFLTLICILFTTWWIKAGAEPVFRCCTYLFYGMWWDRGLGLVARLKRANQQEYYDFMSGPLWDTRGIVYVVALIYLFFKIGGLYWSKGRHQ